METEVRPGTGGGALPPSPRRDRKPTRKTVVEFLADLSSGNGEEDEMESGKLTGLQGLDSLKTPIGASKSDDLMAAKRVPSSSSLQNNDDEQPTSGMSFVSQSRSQPEGTESQEIPLRRDYPVITPVTSFEENDGYQSVTPRLVPVPPGALDDSELEAENQRKSGVTTLMGADDELDSAGQGNFHLYGYERSSSAGFLRDFFTSSARPLGRRISDSTLYKHEIETELAAQARTTLNTVQFNLDHPRSPRSNELSTIKEFTEPSSPRPNELSTTKEMTEFDADTTWDPDDVSVGGLLATATDSDSTQEDDLHASTPMTIEETAEDLHLLESSMKNQSYRMGEIRQSTDDPDSPPSPWGGRPTLPDRRPPRYKCTAQSIITGEI
jgi:hypothetical protein